MQKTVLISLDELETIIINCVTICLRDHNNNSGQVIIKDKILSLNEAAQYINLPPALLKKAISKHKFFYGQYNLPIIKKGNKIFFQKKELSDWLIEKGKRGLIKESKQISEHDST